ncbi:MAG TPA: class II aldolase/adducin family protein, partial [Treponemataceae bacterium]|nr:class II aldolase/adducin family protein [Treponemataceae bacterium]
SIVCTPFIQKDAVERDYEKETGLLIIKTFLEPASLGLKQPVLNPQENPMVLVAGHGPFTWGKTADKSVYNSAVLEEIAKMAWISLSINPQMNVLPEYILQKHYNRKHGKNAYYGQQRN